LRRGSRKKRPFSLSLSLKFLREEEKPSSSQLRSREFLFAACITKRCIVEYGKWSRRPGLFGLTTTSSAPSHFSLHLGIERERHSTSSIIIALLIKGCYHGPRLNDKRAKRERERDGNRTQSVSRMNYESSGEARTEERTRGAPAKARTSACRA
jgi:hypothetical protein